MDSQLHISNDRLSVDVDAEHGGRIAQISVGGTPLLVSRDEVPDDLRDADGAVQATAWGAYPMVPWAGRIRHGRFSFRDNEYQLPINFGDHAIHGVGFESSWRVGVEEPERVRLDLELPADERWPFRGTVSQDISLAPTDTLLVMTVTAGEHAFPVSFGWHPWFRKPSRVDFHPARMYRRDDAGITVDELIEVPPGPWDDCFANTLPIAISIDDVNLQLTSDCTEWVVFDERDHATCIEPQTGPPDAFTIAPRVLEPGESHTAWYRIAIVA